jgi:signal peptidase I
MQAARLDRRVRKEATALVKEARLALHVQRAQKPARKKVGDLEAAIQEVDAGLAAKDYRRVRHALPVLDGLVEDTIVRAKGSSTLDFVQSIGTAVLIALALRTVVVEAFKIPSASMYPTVEINDHIFVNKLIYGVRIPFTTVKFGQFRTPHRGEVIVFIQPCDTERDFIKRVIATEGQTVEVRCNKVYVDGEQVDQQLVTKDLTYEDQPEGSNEWNPTPVSEFAERVGDRTYHTFHTQSREGRDEELARTGGLRQSDRNDFPILGGHHDPPSCEVAPRYRNKAPNQLKGEIVETKAGASACELQRHYVVPKGHIFMMGDNRDNSEDSRVWGSVPVENVKGKALFIWLSYRDFTFSGFRWDRIGSLIH